MQIGMMEKNITSDIGIENFRDIGGYAGKGSNVKRNKLYRSAKLDNITQEGRKLLDTLNIKAIIDFRDDDEVNNSPTAYDREGLLKLRLPISSGDFKSFVPHLISGKLKDTDAEALMCSAYRSFVTKHSNQYARFLSVLLDESSYPILFHCTAGKDRTGYAAALLLSLLGVEWSDVLSNYLLTNVYLKEFIEKVDKGTIPPVARRAFDMLMIADEQYLDTAFTVIGKDYEGVCNYAATVLNFGNDKQQQLRTMLLE